MTTMTPDEIRDTLALALGDRAHLLRKDAASRKFTGPARADFRALIRAEAQRCEDLQRILGHVSPDKLAAALEA